MEIKKKRYYLDTSIWLDFLEDRNEPNFPKGKWAKELIEMILEEDGEIILSDNNIFELQGLGYSSHYIGDLLESLSPSMAYVESTENQISRAKDLSQKRDVPKRDALHALIARDNGATLVTLDNHFKRLSDISMPHSPKDIISF
jgi:predicted nucleic acid-binding protein